VISATYSHFVGTATTIKEQGLLTIGLVLKGRLIMRSQLITKIIFWLAFGAFLSVSIPHVAWMYHAYEPQDLPIWWVIAYAVAVGIDILVCWLSWIQSNGNRSDRAVTWVFIGLLAALSWYGNYLYSMAHNPAYQVNIWMIDLGFGVTTGQVTPVIVSAIPVFIIGYTYMLGKVNNASVKPKTAKELQAEADELEQAAEAKHRIATVKRAGKVSLLTGFIDGVTDVAKHARDATQSALLSQVGNEQDATQPAPGYATLDATPDATQSARDTQHWTQEKHTDKLARINEQDATQTDEQSAGITEGINEQDATQSSVLDGATSQRSVTIKEASLLLNLSESYVRTLVNNGKLRNTPRNKKRILKSSVDAYKAARKDTSKEEAITQGKTRLIIAPDEQDNIEQNESITLSMIEQRMYDALMKEPEKVAELLKLSQEQDITSFTAMLKKRYSEYASYITDARVSNVLAYAMEHNHAALPATNGHHESARTEELVPLNVG
jgi:excisionase family DNA binding protein